MLLALAAMAPSAERDQAPPGSIPLDWFHWLPLADLRLLDDRIWPGLQKAFTFSVPAPVEPPAQLDGELASRLGAAAFLRNLPGSLRVGWMFVAGTHPGPDGEPVRTFQPLLSRAVRVVRRAGQPWGLVPDGDVFASALIADPVQRQRLISVFKVSDVALTLGSPVEVSAQLLGRLPRLTAWAQHGAALAGVESSRLVPAGASPLELMQHDPPVLVAGLAVYLTIDGSAGTSLAGTLREWSATTAIWTGFHSLYLPAAVDERVVRLLGPQGRPPGFGRRDVGVSVEPDGLPMGVSPVSPFPLTPAQRATVLSSRRQPVTVVQGAPGTGKSHTIVAVALDAVARGESVLVAARASATVDALVDLFERSPGAQPVVFGSTDRRLDVADELAAIGASAVPLANVAALRQALAAQVDERDAAFDAVVARLAGESLLDEPWDPRLHDARDRWPDLFAPDADLVPIGADLALAEHDEGGWLSRHRRHKAVDRLDEISGADSDADRAAFARAHRLASALRQADAIEREGGLLLDDRLVDLAAAGAAAEDATASWLDAAAHSRARLGPTGFDAIGKLAIALRSGRAARRAALVDLTGALQVALPLWLGTLEDIDDLLPRRARSFDLVILDEASAIDQPSAATALLRGRRAVVVGDPHQLRPTTFLSDADQSAAVAAMGLDQHPTLPITLDIRRNSAFDVAAGVAPTLVLDEQFRSDPHLVDFVARRLYGGQVHVAGRTPASEIRDAVDVIRVAGERDGDGVVHAEVDAVLHELRLLRDRGATSVGVVTPFRAQADAIERRIVKAWSLDEVEALDLRVGTVHGSQGVERDVEILSIGVGEGDEGRAWSFVQDAHLFTVMVTRARRRLVVVLAGEPPAGGLLAELLAQGDAPPGPPPLSGPRDAWTEQVADRLTEAGLRVRAGYPTGRHVLDLCVGDASAFVGVTTGVHPGGPHAHVERDLALRRAGWPLVDAFASRWRDDLDGLVTRVGAGVAPLGPATWPRRPPPPVARAGSGGRPTDGEPAPWHPPPERRP